MQNAVSANDLGVALHQLCRESEARDWLERALTAWKSVPNVASRYAQTAGSLASVERILGQYAEAENHLRSAAELAGLDDQSKVNLLSQLGDLMREEGRFSDARTLLQQARNVPGASADQRIQTEIALAELDRDTNNWDASLEEWGRAAETARESHNSGAGAVITRGVGQTWMDRGQLARAEPLLRSALAQFEAEPRRDDGQISTTLASLGQLYLQQDKLGMAEEALDRALQGDERSLGPAHPQVAIVLEALAETVAIRNQADLARNYMDRAEKIMVARFGEHSVTIAGVWANRGAVEMHLNNVEGAVANYRKALDGLRGSGPDYGGLRATVIRQYAEVLKAAHRKREAAELLAEAKKSYR